MVPDSEIPEIVRVLLIDDDEEDYIIIKKIFDRVPLLPFKLEWVAEFDAAVTLIESRKHDIYLVDYRLGERTGLDLLRLVAPQDRSEPFIFLTGATDREVERRSMKLAASNYLVKGSFDAEQLSRTLHYALQRKQIEDQRLQHLVELNRSKDEFISIASHQLRTPATGVKQYIGMLLEGFMGEVDPAHRQMLERAYDSNERQLRIVSDLLKVAQVDAGKVKIQKTAVSLNEFILDIIREQQATFKRRDQTVIYEAIQPDTMVNIDHDLMRMVLENLIDNASKYSEEGLAITVAVDGGPDDVRIHIIDEGVGIDVRDRPRLFEKFSRINNPLSTKVGGTGLGLYWAKKVVDLHDGSITYKARKPHGSMFTVCLPG